MLLADRRRALGRLGGPRRGGRAVPGLLCGGGAYFIQAGGARISCRRVGRGHGPAESPLSGRIVALLARQETEGYPEGFCYLRLVIAATVVLG